MHLRRTRGHRAEAGGLDLRSEAGASLVMVMVFMIVFFTIIAALLGLVFTANRTVNTYKQDRALRYAADSALEIAVVKVQNDFDLGDHPGGELCASLVIDGSGSGLPDHNSLFVSGSEVRVNCGPTPGSIGGGAEYRDITFTVTCGHTGGGPDERVNCNPGAAAGDQVVLGEARVRYDADPGHPVATERARVPKIVSWVLHR